MAEGGFLHLLSVFDFFAEVVNFEGPFFVFPERGFVVFAILNPVFEADSLGVDFCVDFLIVLLFGFGKDIFVTFLELDALDIFLDFEDDVPLDVFLDLGEGFLEAATVLKEVFVGDESSEDFFGDFLDVDVVDFFGDFLDVDDVDFLGVFFEVSDELLLEAFLDFDAAVLLDLNFDAARLEDLDSPVAFLLDLDFELPFPDFPPDFLTPLFFSVRPALLFPPDPFLLPLPFLLAV